MWKLAPRRYPGIEFTECLHFRCLPPMFWSVFRGRLIQWYARLVNSKSFQTTDQFFDIPNDGCNQTGKIESNNEKIWWNGYGLWCMWWRWTVNMAKALMRKSVSLCFQSPIESRLPIYHEFRGLRNCVRAAQLLNCDILPHTPREFQHHTGSYLHPPLVTLET